MQKTIYDKEVKDKIMTRYIKNLVMAENLIDTIIPIVWQFDGKVFNRRFENALKERIESRKIHTENKTVYCYVDCDYRKISIELRFYNHRTAEDGGYIPNGYENIYIAYHYCDWSSWNEESNKKYYQKDNKEYYHIDNGNIRLHAESIVNLLFDKQKEIKEKIKELKTASEHVEETWQKVYELKEKLSKLHDSIPHAVDTIYGIESYGTYCS